MLVSIGTTHKENRTRSQETRAQHSGQACRGSREALQGSTVCDVRWARLLRLSLVDYSRRHQRSLWSVSVSNECRAQRLYLASSQCPGRPRRFSRFNNSVVMLLLRSGGSDRLFRVLSKYNPNGSLNQLCHHACVASFRKFKAKRKFKSGYGRINL